MSAGHEDELRERRSLDDDATVRLPGLAEKGTGGRPRRSRADYGGARHCWRMEASNRVVLTPKRGIVIRSQKRAAVAVLLTDDVEVFRPERARP